MLDKTLLKIALDLSLSLPKKAHYKRLMQAVNEVMPCDAVALLELEGDKLVPVAIDGLSPEVLNMKFNPEEHPRLKAILSSRKPIRFDADSSYPDPYDGLLAIDPKRTLDVHDCMGCCLYVEEKLVGVLTLDALTVGAFRAIDDITIATIAALAAATIRNAKLIAQLEQKNEQSICLANELVKEARDAKGSSFIGKSASMRELKNEIKVVAQSQLSVLITGETGVGKEVVARTLHAESLRNNNALVQINCAALSESIIESELFGHVKGAFTGADKERIGKFELANKGTLFLDEIGELSLNGQAKLLRALQEGEIQRVGMDKNIYVDVRIIAATNRNLLEEVEQGRFREDLYHRLSVFPLHIPALRNRIEDIPELSSFILDNIKGKLGTNNVKISQAAMELLMHYDWPGNVRELQHVLMRAGLRATTNTRGKQGMIEPEHLGLDIPTAAQIQDTSALLTHQNLPFNEAVANFQRKIIISALTSNDYIWAKAARELQLDRANLYRLSKRLGIDISQLQQNKSN
ncbi:nitric oxide reductase transcriptional regulator NorR [Thalassotalea piscium]|uniref:Anaerobic nitric oxide reductase transcription regulator n=1 Tax=Thalassotalea piscium TaxID=1230533 RepID=A0A7X0NIV8_9GAMM|nr:nitric oxide reductase transcriptional regulator NorR [Thalassotalea piscium]MBB6544235.1 anaerobic nitric oxide reductase transcription regulator [Thalassotalea piscium]